MLGSIYDAIPSCLASVIWLDRMVPRIVMGWLWATLSVLLMPRLWTIADAWRMAVPFIWPRFRLVCTSDERQVNKLISPPCHHWPYKASPRSDTLPIRVCINASLTNIYNSYGRRAFGTFCSIREPVLWWNNYWEKPDRWVKAFWLRLY